VPCVGPDGCLRLAACENEHGEISDAEIASAARTRGTQTRGHRPRPGRVPVADTLAVSVLAPADDDVLDAVL
jgi:hypothetical protein